MSSLLRVYLVHLIPWPFGQQRQALGSFPIYMASLEQSKLRRTKPLKWLDNTHLNPREKIIMKLARHEIAISFSAQFYVFSQFSPNVSKRLVCSLSECVKDFNLQLVYAMSTSKGSYLWVLLRVDRWIICKELPSLFLLCSGFSFFLVLSRF